MWAVASGICLCPLQVGWCCSSELAGSEPCEGASVCGLVPSLKPRMCSDAVRIPRRWAGSPHLKIRPPMYPIPRSLPAMSPEPGHCPLCTRVTTFWFSVVSWYAWWPQHSVFCVFVVFVCVHVLVGVHMTHIGVEVGRNLIELVLSTLCGFQALKPGLWFCAVSALHWPWLASSSQGSAYLFTPSAGSATKPAFLLLPPLTHLLRQGLTMESADLGIPFVDQVSLEHRDLSVSAF